MADDEVMDSDQIDVQTVGTSSEVDALLSPHQPSRENDDVYERTIKSCGFGWFQIKLLLVCGWGLASDSVEVQVARYKDAEKVFEKMFRANSKGKKNLPAQIKDFSSHHEINLPHQKDAENSNTSFSGFFQSMLTTLAKVFLKTIRLFKKPYTTASIVLILIWFTLSFGYYGLWMWFPEIFRRIKNGGSSCGGGSVVMNHTTSPQNCTETVANDNEVYFQSFMIAISNLPGNLITVLIINKLGRRSLLAVSMVLSAVCVFFFWMAKTTTQMLAISCVFSGLSVAGWNALDALALEQYPTDLRSTAFGFQASVGRVAAVLGNIAFGAMVDLHCSVPLLTVAAFLFLESESNNGMGTLVCHTKMAESEVESADRHTHCQSCYKTMCFAHTDCPTVPCGNGCSASYHACKQREHELVCRLEARPCVNRVHGCVRLLNSVQMIRHLEVCAASTVKCPASWNRYPLYSQIREKWLRKVSLKTNPVPVEGVLEVEWAIADQKLLNAQLTRRMKHGRDMISSRPKKVGSLSEQKISDLEQLLAPAKNKKTPKEEECEIMTYDEATAQHPEVFASVVQNTNIRDGYYDLPEPATTGRYGCQLSDDEKEDEQGSTKMHALEVDVCFEPSEEQVSARQAKLMRVKLNTYPLGLNTVVETMPRFQNQYPMYSFTCGRVMRRDEYTNHYQNTHCDVQPHLNGWMLRRCPLASQGCPYTVTRLRPRHKNVRLSPVYGCITATVETPVLSTPARTQAEFFDQKNTSCSENVNVTNASNIDNFDETNSKNADNFEDTNLIKLEKPEPLSLEELHQDVLEYLFTFLDALSLNCVARTSAYLRALCGNLLNKRGVIVHVWKRRDRQSINPTTWCRSKQIQFFSTSCSLMRDWHYTDTPAMGEHLCKCAFFTRPKYGAEKIPALSAPLKREMEGKFKSKT